MATKRRAQFARGLDLALGLLARIDLRRAAAAAAPRQCRQRIKRGARAAEMIDQCAEGARPDILAADKPQPVDPLLVGETNAFPPFAHIAPERRLACSLGRATIACTCRRTGRVSEQKPNERSIACAPILLSVPRDQPRDIVAVHDPEQHREQEKKRRLRDVAAPRESQGAARSRSAQRARNSGWRRRSRARSRRRTARPARPSRASRPM